MIRKQMGLYQRTYCTQAQEAMHRMQEGLAATQHALDMLVAARHLSSPLRSHPERNGQTSEGMETARQTEANQAAPEYQLLPQLLPQARPPMLVTAAAAAAEEGGGDRAVDAAHKHDPHAASPARGEAERGEEEEGRDSGQRAPPDWKERMEQQANLLRAATREVSNLKRTLKTMPPSPGKGSSGTGGAGGDARGGGGESGFETKMLQAETRCLNKKVEVLESALDDVSTVVDKTCAILRLQTTNFLQSSRSTHALAVAEVEKSNAEGRGDRAALANLQQELALLQDELKTLKAAAAQAHQNATVRPKTGSASSFTTPVRSREDAGQGGAGTAGTNNGDGSSSSTRTPRRPGGHQTPQASPNQFSPGVRSSVGVDLSSPSVAVRWVLGRSVLLLCGGTELLADATGSLGSRLCDALPVCASTRCSWVHACAPRRTGCGCAPAPP